MHSSILDISSQAVAHDHLRREQNVTIEFGSRQAFLDKVSLSRACAQLLIPPAMFLGPAVRVICQIRLAGEASTFVVRGTSMHVDPSLPSAASQVAIEIRGAELSSLGRAYAHARGLPEYLGWRAEGRRRTALEAVLWTEGGKHPGTVTNLSLGGLRISNCPVPASKGTWVNVQIGSWFHRTVRLAGRIAWVEARSAGIKLLDYERADRAWIIRTLEQALVES